MSMSKENILALQKLLSPNLPLHIILENEVAQTQYGQITFNVIIKDGEAHIETLNIVKNKRIRYKLTR